MTLLRKAKDMITRPTQNEDDDKKPSMNYEESSGEVTQPRSTIPKWRWKCDSICALLSFNINIYMLWYLPYLGIEFGGACFLFCYGVTVVLVCIPLYYLQLGTAQYSGFSLIKIWKAVPIMTGIGYGSLLVTFLVTIYQSIVIAWAIHYIAITFIPGSGWGNCGNLDWSTAACSLLPPDCSNTTLMEDVTYCNNQPKRYLFGYSEQQNISIPKMFPFVWKIPAEEMFHNHVLWLSEGIGHVGQINWRLLICLFGVWFMVMVMVRKGCRTTIWISYIHLIFGTVLGLIVLLRLISAPGGALGLKYFFKPKWHKLASVRLWGESSLYAFFSLFISWGVVGSIGCYSKPKDQFHHDAVLAPFGSFIVSIVFGSLPAAATVIVANHYELNDTTFKAQGPELIFVIMTEAFSMLPAGRLWSTLFYIYFILLGFAPLCWLVETSVTSLCDAHSKRLGQFRFTVLLCFSSLAFLLGLVMITQGGFYFVFLFSKSVGSFTILVLALLELIGFVYIYGYKKLFIDFETMIASSLNSITKTYLIATWHIICPVLLCLMIIYCWSTCKHLHYHFYKYPPGARLLCWILLLAPLVLLIVVSLATIFSMQGQTFWQKTKKALKSSGKWEASTYGEEQERDDEGMVGEQNGNGVEKLETIGEQGEKGELDKDRLRLPPIEVNVPENVNTTFVKIAGTEPAMKKGKINRASQMTVDVKTQTKKRHTRFAPDDTAEDTIVDKRHKERRHKHRHKHSSKLPPISDSTPRFNFDELNKKEKELEEEEPDEVKKEEMEAPVIVDKRVRIKPASPNPDVNDRDTHNSSATETLT